MLEWGFWIGPLIAIVLALRLRPTFLIVLAGAAIISFMVSFSTSMKLYDECEPCSTRAEALFWVNTILFTIAPALLLLGVAKAALNAWLRQRRGGSGFSAKPS